MIPILTFPRLDWLKINQNAVKVVCPRDPMILSSLFMTKYNFICLQLMSLSNARGSYFRGKKLHKDWDLRVEQADFQDISLSAASSTGVVVTLREDRAGTRPPRWHLSRLEFHLIQNMWKSGLLVLVCLLIHLSWYKVWNRFSFSEASSLILCWFDRTWGMPPRITKTYFLAFNLEAYQA